MHLAAENQTFLKRIGDFIPEHKTMVNLWKGKTIFTFSDKSLKDEKAGPGKHSKKLVNPKTNGQTSSGGGQDYIGRRQMQDLFRWKQRGICQRRNSFPSFGAMVGLGLET